ncbi:MAG TPA: prolyl oligopeptidase family serine peptidase, partial [Steroidobacteraceae bacterium]|nr:prolyl oligopeptidase family serine peptidase [Steroidobacteraceae bacterium]
NPVPAQVPYPAIRVRGNLRFDGLPEPPAALAARLAAYLNGRDATCLDWLPDDTLLIGTRFGESEQVHRLTQPLGMREQLTWYADAVRSAAAPRSGAVAGFAFLKDPRQPQVYYYRFADREAQPLTARGSHGSLVWSRDGLHLAFYGTERDGSTWDTYVVEPGAAAGSARAPTLAVAGREHPWRPVDWSVDGRKLLLLQRVSGTESYLYLGDVQTGSVTPLDTTGRHIGIGEARFAPDGRGIYFTSDENGEFEQLRYLDMVTHQARDVTTNLSWDVNRFDVSADGHYIAYTVNEDGHDRLTVLDTRLNLELSPPGLPAGLIDSLRFDPTGTLLAITAEGPRAAADVYVYEPARNRLTRWTRSESPLEPANPVDPLPFQYPTWDRSGLQRRLIPAFFYRPRGGGRHPVLILLHDDPQGQFRPGYDPFIQFAVNELGYAVVAPNVRGSSGYGKSFLALGDGRQREDALRDVGALLVWVGLQGDLDRSRVVVMGESYGGFLALSALAAYGDRLRGGIDVDGIADLTSYVSGGPPGRAALRREEFGDERDPDTRAWLNDLSPLQNLAQIRRPLLVAQGADDLAVTPDQAGQIVASLRARGFAAWYLEALDEGQVWRHKASRDALMLAEAQFLAQMAQ